MSSIIIAERIGSTVTIYKEGHGSMTFMIGNNSTVPVTPGQIAYLKEATLGNIEAALKKVGLTLIVSEFQNVDAFRESLARQRQQQQFMNPISQPFFPQQPGVLPSAFQTMNPRFWHGTTPAPKELLNAQFLMGKYSHLVQIITQRVYVHAHLESGVSEQERVHLRAQIDNLNAEETCIRKAIEKATTDEKENVQQPLKETFDTEGQEKTRPVDYDFLLSSIRNQLQMSVNDSPMHRLVLINDIVKDVKIQEEQLGKYQKTFAELQNNLNELINSLKTEVEKQLQNVGETPHYTDAESLLKRHLETLHALREVRNRVLALPTTEERIDRLKYLELEIKSHIIAAQTIKSNTEEFFESIEKLKIEVVS